MHDKGERLEERYAMKPADYSISYDEIAEVVAKVKACIDEHQAYLSGGPGAEARTRTFLIDQLLRSVGWEVLDPNQVQLEYRLSTRKRVDYVLQTSDTPQVIVEAKSLGIDQKQDALNQLYDYMDDETLSTVNIGVLTDGDEWHVYQRGRRSEANTLKVTTTADNYKVAIFLDENIGRSNFALDNEPTGVRNGGGTSPPQPPGNWYPLGRPMPRDKAPTAIRIDGGPSQPLRYWYDLYMVVSRHLLKSGSLDRARVPLTAKGGTRYLVNSSPTFADGKPFFNGKKFADGLWLDANGGAKWIPWKSAKLIEACGGDPGTVEVCFD